MGEKQREYNKLPLQSVEQIYASIEANLPDEYVYSKNTTIYIIDSNNNECIDYKIPEIELKNVNQLHPMARGTYIYDLYNSEILKE